MMQEWFKKAKLGIFIHYGIYAVDGVSESWSFFNGRISYEDYMKQLDGFTASKLDMEHWADLIEKSGAKYAVLTSKHHDGVALWDTQYSDLNVVKKTPAKRDIVKEYCEAIQKRGIKTGIYFSLLDWSHPDYCSIYQEGSVPGDYIHEKPFSSPMDGVEKPEVWAKFLQHNRNQMTELMTHYGTVDLLWFDGDWERSAEQWKMADFREFLHTLNPNVVLNSRMQGYGDYKTPEQGIPVQRPEGPWEFCTTINTSWGYQHSDNDYKTPRQIIRMFCDCLTMGGNMLLDIGPMEDGTIDPRQENVLLELGSWIRANEEAVFETEAGIGWDYFLGGSTLSPDKKTIYLMVYDTPVEDICLKGINSPIKKISLLASGRELKWHITGGAPWNRIPGMLWVSMGPEDVTPYATVVKVELEEPLELYGGRGEVISNNE